MSTLLRLLPSPLKRAARHIRNEFRTISAARYLNRHGVDVVRFAANARDRASISNKKCPACGYEGPFKPYGNPPRWDAACPSCGGFERHRFLAVLLNEGLLKGKSNVLHFAPETGVSALLRRFATRYVTADLIQPDVDLKLNIEETGLPNEIFDAIVCSHVLQYVDDKKALPELRRILRPNGLLVVMIPIVEGISSFEDVTRDPNDYLPKQRIYGSDFRDLLRGTGFDFKEHIAEGSIAIDYALTLGDKIFVCTKA
jgi:SAM-dependent methyltransferase